MELSLPANYDAELIPKLEPYPVSEVYGKFPSDFVGGGRPSYMGTPLSERALRDYVALLDRHGIAFNYLLNSACIGNREWTRRWQKRLMRFLEKLQRWGIRRLTVSTPFLLEAIKARFPDFFIKVGIFAQIDTAVRARFWEHLGADGLTLESFSINRDFRKLRSVRAAVSCELQLIPNIFCLPNCPMEQYHHNGFAHASDGSGGIFIDYCFLRCTRRRIEDPSLLIKSAWIRPEDIATYEAIGYTSFKLIERGIPSSEVLKRARAYSERRFDGNLAELILSYGFKEPLRKQRLWAVRHFFKPFQVSPLKLKPFYDLMRHQGMLFPADRSPFHIDNSRIPEGFIRAFESRDCASLDCRECRYCEDIARQAVRLDPEFQRQSLERFAAAEKAMATGSLWNV